VPDIVSTTALRKEFRGFAAVRDVDLRVAEGSVHALVGPNGAGKTTLFNMLTGFLTRRPGGSRSPGRTSRASRPSASPGSASPARSRSRPCSRP